MKFSTLVSPLATLALLTSLASAGSGEGSTSGGKSKKSTAAPSLCDKYSTALFNSTNATAQSTLLTALVNTAVIGSYSPLGDKLKVDGILADGTFNNTPVSLLKYFDGSLKSTNVKGVATSVNFLDGGGAAPLKENKPANDNNSAQYVLLTHLYEYFGAALGCSSQKKDGPFSTYTGSTSMSNVHRYMNLDENEVGYFITQVGMAAVSFGVSTEDATSVGTLLGKVFGTRCAPAMAFPPGGKAASQSICLASTCPLAESSDCKLDASTKSYPNGTNGVEPAPGNGKATTGSSSSSSGTASASSTGGNATAAQPTSAAAPGAFGPIQTLINLFKGQNWAALAALGLGAFGVATLL